jgi:hypothetical protein
MYNRGKPMNTSTRVNKMVETLNIIYTCLGIIALISPLGVMYIKSIVKREIESYTTDTKKEISKKIDDIFKIEQERRLERQTIVDLTNAQLVKSLTSIERHLESIGSELKEHNNIITVHDERIKSHEKRLDIIQGFSQG